MNTIFILVDYTETEHIDTFPWQIEVFGKKILPRVLWGLRATFDEDLHGLVAMCDSIVET